MSTPEEHLPTPTVVDVSLRPSATQETVDQPLWSAIRNRTDAIGFNRYDAFIRRLLESSDDEPGIESEERGAKKPARGDTARAEAARVLEVRRQFTRRPLIHSADAYQLLKFATHAFLAMESGVAVLPQRFSTETGSSDVSGEEYRLGQSFTYDELQAWLTEYLQQEVGGVKGEVLPYLKRVVGALLGPNTDINTLPHYGDIIRRRVESPSLLELIWSYWHEQGMLVQSINSIALRFQNRRQGAYDPLAQLALDPLRPLNNLLWGFVQDEVNRLSVVRRAHEYRHAYGLTMYGKALSQIEPADDRSRFVEALHNLLRRAVEFYREDADTTLRSDGFALMNALKELHGILAEGAHNQFGDLPTVARAEMMMMQWLLARPELREFLGGRPMVTYPENWMRQADTMKRIKGWSDVSINHFRDLGVYGEKLLLSIRYGDWVDINNQEHARNWARYWKPEVQSYIHSYLAATGVDLTVTDVGDSPRTRDRNLQPSVHLRRRLAEQQARIAPTSPRMLSKESLALSERAYSRSDAE
jgi:hypothetical protein